MNQSTENPTAPILSVSQLTQAIKLNLETTFPSLYLQGEISNFKLQTSGHLYFSLKDQHAQIAAVMFRSSSAILAVPPKNGDQVIVKGDLNVYPSKGNYQIVVRELSYVGIGELLQRLEELKIKLHQKGWFKSVRKKPLPRFPKRIGVITSPTGAVIQDILNILSRRFAGFNLILNPVKVQGEGAAQEIAQAIRQFNEHQLVDVMIIGRGGGSLEDLWAFNEEIVAQAIYDSTIPIISAVGHETDHCIADYVADVRAPTPSAAAEIVIAEKAQQLDYLATLKKRMQQAILHHIQKNRYRLSSIVKHPLIARPLFLLEPFMQRLDDIRLSLELAINQFFQVKKHQLEIKAQQIQLLRPSTQLAHFKQKLSYFHAAVTQAIQSKIERDKASIQQKLLQLQQTWTQKNHQRRQLFDEQKIRKRLDHSIGTYIATIRERLSNLINIRNALDPKNLLNKGYTILFSEKDGSVINTIQQLKENQKAKLRLSDGEALITINEVFKREL